jgi:hypothetical protein
MGFLSPQKSLNIAWQNGMATMKILSACQVQCISRCIGIFVPTAKKNTLLFCNWNFNLNGCFEDVSNI